MDVTCRREPHGVAGHVPHGLLVPLLLPITVASCSLSPSASRPARACRRGAPPGRWGHNTWFGVATRTASTAVLVEERLDRRVGAHVLSQKRSASPQPPGRGRRRRPGGAWWSPDPVRWRARSPGNHTRRARRVKSAALPDSYPVLRSGSGSFLPLGVPPAPTIGVTASPAWVEIARAILWRYT